jgi:hypothetical protein
VLPNMSLSYVTANPASYLYLNTYRPAESQLRLCPQHDNYKYALDDRNGYRIALSDEQIRLRQGLFPSARHDLIVVSGVGHDHDAMFNSVPGKTAIFAPPACPVLRRTASSSPTPRQGQPIPPARADLVEQDGILSRPR